MDLSQVFNFSMSRPPSLNLSGFTARRLRLVSPAAAARRCWSHFPRPGGTRSEGGRAVLIRVLALLCVVLPAQFANGATDAPAARWDGHLGVTSGYDSNVQRRRVASASPFLATQADSHFARRSGTLAGDLWTNGFYRWYSASDAPEEFGAKLEAKLSYPFGLALPYQWEVGAGGEWRRANDPFLGHIVETTSASASGAIDIVLYPKWHSFVTFGHSRTDQNYDRAGVDQEGDVAISNRATQVGIGLRHPISEKLQTSASYQFTSVTASGGYEQSNDQHQLSLSASGALTPRLHGSIASGVQQRAFASGELSSDGLTPFLSLSVRWSPARRVAFEISGSQAYSTTSDNRSSDLTSIGLRWRQEITSRFASELSVSYAKQTITQAFALGPFNYESTRRDTTWSADCTLTYEWYPNLSCRLSLHWEDQDSTNLDRNYDQLRLHLGLSLRLG